MTRARRGLYEGSIFEAGGKWWAVISLVINGRRGRRKRSAPTKQQALDRLAELKAKHLGVDSIAASSRTVGDVASAFLDDLERRRAPSTHRHVEGCWRLHLAPRLGRTQLATLRAGDVRRVLDDLERIGAGKRRGSSGSAARMNAFITLRKILTWSVAQGLATRNVTDGIPRPRHAPATRSVWSVDDARRFITSARGLPFFAGCVLALGLGLRIGEVRGLRWRDVDLDGGILHVRQQATDQDGIRGPKTARARRSIRIPRVAVVALREHRAALRKLGVFVFASRNNTPISPSIARARWKRAVAAAKVPDIRFHDLRHTSATFLLASGEPAHVVAEILGHSSVTTTLAVYAHVLAPMRDRAAERIDEALSGEPPGSLAVSGAVARRRPRTPKNQRARGG